MSNIFNNVDRPKVRRSSLDLSHEYKTTQDIFDLIPISVIECVPGDVHKIGVASVLRLQPMLAPILQRIKVRFSSFFVPYRLLDSNWEQFITRNPDGDSVVNLPVFDPDDYTTPADVYAQGSLWDYLGYPLLKPAAAACPLDYPRRAYYRIWNDYMRDENLEAELDYEDPAENCINILKAAFDRDLYTSSLPFRQKGTPPALPVFGSASAAFDFPYQNVSGVDTASLAVMAVHNGSVTGMGTMTGIGGTNSTMGGNNVPTANTEFENLFTDNNTISGATFSSADISDLRLASQIQIWMERNARGGTRYVEFLRAQFGTSPTEEVLQRPAFIGGVSSDVIVSEVLQTSASDTQPTPQGNLAGHGVGLTRGFLGSYRCKEFGLIMTFATVVPIASYQQGIERAWLRRTTFDFPFPVFTGLSEQEVFNAEIYTRDQTADPTGSINFTPFGYTGRYNELRFVPNKVTNEMRDTFDYWHMGRKFSSAPALDAAFIRPTAAEVTELKRVFAVPSVPCLIASYGIQLTSHRPIPYMAIPSALGGLT